MHSQMEQAAVTSILTPIENSLVDADSASGSAASKPESAESGGLPGSQGRSGAGPGAALLGSDLLARVDELVRKCSETKASIKQMRSR